jgi:AhpD family alkylhydroperoxidase
MTRIDAVSARRAGVFSKFAYRQTRRQFGRMVDPVAVYAHTPGLLFGYGLLEQATARQKLVPERLKVLAELKAAALVNCEFCADIGSSIARDAGVTEAELLALSRYRDSDEFDALEKLVLDYAVAMSRTPTRVTDELFAQLRTHLDERQLVELTNVIALENMRARFNSAFDMTPAGFSEGMVCVPLEQESPRERATPAESGAPLERDAPPAHDTPERAPAAA